MGIQPVTTQIPTLQASPINTRATENATDWKTYTLVILSNLLVIAGIALACASIYFATFVHPMLAVGSPIFPIGAGIALARSTASKVSAIAFRKKTAGQLRGIENKKGLDCWMISSLQGLFNIPMYRKVLEDVRDSELKSDEDKIRYYDLLPFINQMNNYDLGLPVDANFLRKCLYHATWTSNLKSPPLSDPKKNLMEDAWEVFKFILDQADFQLPSATETVVTKIGKKVTRSTNKIGENDTRPTRYFEFPLGEYRNVDEIPFETVFEGFFQKIEPTPDSWGKGINEITTKFDSPPEDFTCNFNRVDYESVSFGKDGTMVSDKVKTKVNVPLKLTVGADKFGKKEIYRLRYFVVHHGKTTKSGHYISYFLEDNKWYYLNDDNTPVEVDEAKIAEINKDSYIIHYQKS